MMRRTTSVLFISSCFPPEVNALANRTAEHAGEWVRHGGDVEILTGPPHFPEGRVYPGYENTLGYERIDGVGVLRVPMYVAPNEGFWHRTLSYVSFLVSTVWNTRHVNIDPGVVVASTPQFFAGLAGWSVSRLLQCPFVLEVRDLWPESIVEVGAMKRGIVIRMLEKLEAFLYRSADHVVIVSPAFQDHVEARGVPADRISVLPNGVDVGWFEEPQPASDLAALRDDLGLEGRFLASYIGTVGMAHGIETLAEAARRSKDPDLVFLVAGAGAEWERIHAIAEAGGLDNLRVLAKQPREKVRQLYAVTDVSIVHLRDRPAFRKVIPSKMFESMAMRCPIVLGVEGQARQILEAAGAGLAVPPEDPDALLSALLELKADSDRRERMGAAGVAHVARHYDRRAIAVRYWELLQDVATCR